MDISDMRARIQSFLSEQFLIEFGAGVDGTTDLFAQGLVDSFGFIELVSFLERSFGCEFDNEEVMLGGVTKVLLDSMTVPVMMSH